MRILWVTPSLPRRGRSAFQERTWSLLAQLTARHEVSLLTFDDADDAAAGDDALPPGLQAVRRVRCAPQWDSDPLALLPATVRSRLADPTARVAVDAALRERTYDVVQFELIEAGHVMPAPRVTTLLTVHQVGSAQVEPQWRAAGGRWAAAPAMLFRRLRDREFEQSAVRRAHRIVALSAEDAGRIRGFAPAVPLSIVPMGVDCSHYRPSPQHRPPAVDLLFVGHFAHPPNEDAVRFLVHDVLPRLGRTVRLRVVGHAPTPAVRALARPGLVEIAGSVADVREELAAARVVVAPVRFGTGMRGKVLEALAMERPVVTTRLGAEGLGARDGIELLLADDAGAVAHAVTRCLDDAALAASLGTRGGALARHRFDWPRVAAAQEDAYEAVRRDPLPVPLPWVDEVPPLALRAARLGRIAGLLAGLAVVAGRARRWRAAAAAGQTGLRPPGNA